MPGWSRLAASRSIAWPLLLLAAALLSGCAAMGAFPGGWFAYGWLLLLATLGACVPGVSSENAKPPSTLELDVGYVTEFDVSSLLGSNGADGSRGFVMTDGYAAGQVGTSIAVGDLNGDGFADVVTGSPETPFPGPSGGQVSVIYGHPPPFQTDVDINAISPLNGRFFLADYAGDRVGTSVAVVKSVNADLIEDLVIGVPRTSGYYGDVDVIFGSTALPPSGPLTPGSLLDGYQGAQLYSVTLNSGTGMAVAGGDINGDGMGDVVMGAPYATYGGNNNGRLYEMLGTAGWYAYEYLSPANVGVNNAILGPFLDAIMGRPIAGGGDVDGDGIDDVVLVAAGLPPVAPQVFVRFGSVTTGLNNSLPTMSPFTLNLPLAYGGYPDLLFQTLTLGDFNGDGLADVIVGEPLANRVQGYATLPDRQTGRVHVIYGGPGLVGSSLAPASLDGINGFSLVGNEPYSRLGGNGIAVGDINGDGLADLVVAVPYGYAPNDPRVYVIFGNGSPTAGERHLSQISAEGMIVLRNFPNATGYVIDAIVANRDIDGDGLNDIVIGWGGSNAGRGQVMVILNTALLK